MAALAEFATVRNIKHCESKFKSVMETRYTTRIADGDTLLKRLLYDIIVEVRDRNASADMSLKELNNMTLNIAYDRFVSLKSQQHAPQQLPRKPREPSHRILPKSTEVLNLERDKDVFGERAVVFNTLLPSSGSGADFPDRQQVSKAYAEVVEDRKPDADATRPGLSVKAVTVDPIGGADFQRLLALKEQERDLDMDMPPASAASAAVSSATSSVGSAVGARRDGLSVLDIAPDPQAVARSAMRDKDSFVSKMAGQDADGRPFAGRAELVIAAPQPEQTRTVDRFLTLCGFDRDPALEPYRYRFTASMSGYGVTNLQGTYKAIEYIEASRLILPMEIVQGNVMAKQNFNYEFSFAFPYVLLSVDGFDGVVDGMNDPVRRALGVFVYDTSYKAPNGRGYVLLKPSQCERKSFTPPLASLRELRMSITKPNGSLFNNSIDAYTVATLQYDLQNRLYLRVVLDQFFDRNELYAGDSVRFRGFGFRPPAGSPTAPYESLAEFLNRPQGHELVQLGTANEQGFYKTFFILAPGVLDQGAGRIIIDSKLVTAVQSLSSPDTASRAFLTGGPPSVMNLSLQVVVNMRLGAREVSTPMAATHVL
jgi:hypothetical protein